MRSFASVWTENLHFMVLNVYNLYMRFRNLTLLSVVVIAFCTSAPAAELRAVLVKQKIADATEPGVALESKNADGSGGTQTTNAQAGETVAKETESSSGLKFRVKLTASIDGAVARAGDPVHGELLDTVTLPGGRFVGTGEPVFGEVTQVQQSKNLLKSNFQIRHWSNANGILSLKVTKIANVELPFEAVPEPKSRIERGNAKDVPLQVDSKGEVMVRYNTKGYTAANVAITGGCMAAGPFGLLLGPVAGGVAGAADPAFAYGRPVTEEEGHTRVKGFFKGMIGGLPGGFLISGATNHGMNVTLNPGDVIVFQERQKEAP